MIFNIAPIVIYNFNDCNYLNIILQYLLGDSIEPISYMIKNRPLIFRLLCDKTNNNIFVKNYNKDEFEKSKISLIMENIENDEKINKKKSFNPIFIFISSTYLKNNADIIFVPYIINNINRTLMISYLITIYYNIVFIKNNYDDKTILHYHYNKYNNTIEFYKNIVLDELLHKYNLVNVQEHRIYHKEKKILFEKYNDILDKLLNPEFYYNIFVNDVEVLLKNLKIKYNKKIILTHIINDFIINKYYNNTIMKKIFDITNIHIYYTFVYNNVDDNIKLIKEQFTIFCKNIIIFLKKLYTYGINNTHMLEIMDECKTYNYFEIENLNYKISNLK